MTEEWTRDLDEDGVVRLAELTALKIARGDVIALRGELGAGKTIFARALIRALLGDPAADVPSPAFSLQQLYESPRLIVSHFDFHRLANGRETSELDFEEAADHGAVIVEWPERVAELLPGDRIEIALAETAAPHVRQVTVRGIGAAAARVRRIGEALAFLDQQPDWAAARIMHLQGDASQRSYARLFSGGRTALLMDAPGQPDGPPVRAGLPYSRIAHLAEDVRPFVAIAEALREAGLSAPRVFAADMPKGLLLIEDFGDRVFDVEVGKGTSQRELWETAVAVLLALRRTPVADRLALPDGTTYALPAYDGDALTIEVELLLDWYWPTLHGNPAPERVRAEFVDLWASIFARLAEQPSGWVLRDFHSPNLIWLPDRAGLRRAGVIDFQDAQRGPQAYDLVSLLQDARVDVPEALESELLALYCRCAAKEDPSFDEAGFRFAYAALGAQRNTKILGIFVRLARRDGKPQYLRHLPRIWRYLARDLAARELKSLAGWYNRYFPPEARAAVASARVWGDES
jgi:tRNA threonylcarbamoyl adenosine modification protein YjeE